MARSTLRTRLFVTEFEDRVVPATVSERIAQAQREAAEAAARNQALLDAQIAAAAEIARIALTTAKDRNEAGEVVLTDDFGNVRRAVRVLADGYTGGAWVAVADVNGDGAPDYLSAPGKGAAPLVKVTDGTTGNELGSFLAYEATFTGGLFVTGADLNGDGKADLVTGTDQGGGPVLAVFDGADLVPGRAPRELAGRFLAIDGDPNFRGGVRVATGDITGDGVADVLVSAGFGGGPRIAAYDGKELGQGKVVKLFGDFFAYESTLRDGAYVGVGDTDGDGKGELLVGAGPGGAPVVAVFNAAARTALGLPSEVRRFLAGDPVQSAGSRAGARVSAILGQDGKADILAIDNLGGGAVVYDGASGRAVHTYDRQVALGGLFDDSTGRNLSDPYAKDRAAIEAAFKGTYRGTTTAPVRVTTAPNLAPEVPTAVTVTLTVETLGSYQNPAADPQTAGGSATFTGRVRVEIAGEPAIDRAVFGRVEFDPYTGSAPTAARFVTAGSDGFVDNSEFVARSLAWTAGVLSTSQVAFLRQDEYRYDSALVTGAPTFMWAKA